MVASVGSLPGGIGKPQPLPVSVRAALSAGGDLFGPAGYDVSLDGQRLLIVQEAEEESAPRQIHVSTELVRGVEATSAKQMIQHVG